MRRVPKILLAAASALVAAPMIVASQALPADAASGKLLVTTIDRSGHSVAGQPLTLLNLATDSADYGERSGHAASVADGRYAVLAGIEQTVNGTPSGTLAATTVTVSGTATTKITLDARKGHLVRVTLDGKLVSDLTDARVCAGGAGPGQLELFEGGPMYVVPSTSRLFSFGYLAQGRGATLSGFTPAGLPASPGGAWTTSHLAKVTLTVRSGEQGADETTAMLQPEPPSGPNCQFDLTGNLAQGQAPYQATELVSPGVWDVRTDDSVSGYLFPHSLAAGHSYSFTYYQAAWGVAGPSTRVHLPIVGHRAISLVAPTITDPTGNGTVFGARSSVTVSLNGHQFAHGTVSDIQQNEVFQAGIKSAGWYTLADDITRYNPGATYPAGILSPRITTSWRFYATPSQAVIAPAFWASFIPAGLNAMNQGKPRAATTIRVVPSRPSWDPNAPVVTDTVTKLQVYVSTDDGKTWHSPSAIARTASGWTVAVNNPASGFVSLRATVTGSHGDTSTETIYRAYAVS